MDKLSEMIDGVAIGSLLPDLSAMMAKLSTVARVAVIVGPAALVILGLVYLFLAPKEANHTLGFRCWWGMSCVEVWQFTQKLAGIVWTALGLVLLIVAIVSGFRYGNMAYDEMLMSALRTILLQIAVVLVSILAINIVLMVLYDHHGNRRSQKEPRLRR